MSEINSPEYMAEKAAASRQIPDKFLREDGSVDVDGLAQSYRELEKAFHSKETPNNEPESNDSEVQRRNDQPVAAPEGDLGSMLDGPKRTVWDRVADDEKSGGITEETLDALKAEGVPEAVIKSYTEGIKARAEARTKQAAESVGGADNLQKAMEFARNNFSPAQLESFKQQLNGPTWELALKGLALQAGLNPNGKAPEPKSLSTSTPSAHPDLGVAKPFETQAEMVAAVSSQRYRLDADFRNWVGERVRATQNRS